MKFDCNEVYRNPERILRATKSLVDEFDEMNERILGGKPSVFSAATLILSVFDFKNAVNPIEEYGYRYRRLLYLSNNTSECYREKVIPKKSGGNRRLLIPNPELMLWQMVIKDNVLTTYSISDRAFAYKKGVSVRDNAAAHIGHECIVRIDIKDFFDSISYNVVYNALLKSPYYNDSFIALVANLCCVNGHIPQGACTSPTLSNICFLRVDDVIVEFCKKQGITYTRYCDDLIFSGNSFNPYKLIGVIYSILKAFGYKPNKEKTSIRNRGQRMEVTGITINERLRVNKDYRKKIRQDVYYIRKFGVKSHILRSGAERFISNGRCKKKQYLISLLGKVQYVLFIDPNDAEMKGYCGYLKDELSKRYRHG